MIFEELLGSSLSIREEAGADNVLKYRFERLLGIMSWEFSPRDYVKE